MTKRDIVLKLSDIKPKLKQSDIMDVVQGTLDIIVNALTGKQTIELRNFGVFKVKTRKAKKGRNPRTGEEVPVPERNTVVFKPGLVMKNRVGKTQI